MIFLSLAKTCYHFYGGRLLCVGMLIKYRRLDIKEVRNRKEKQLGGSLMVASQIIHCLQLQLWYILQATPHTLLCQLSYSSWESYLMPIFSSGQKSFSSSSVKGSPFKESASIVELSLNYSVSSGSLRTFKTSRRRVKSLLRCFSWSRSSWVLCNLFFRMLLFWERVSKAL